MVTAYPQATLHSVEEIEKVPTSPYVKNFTLKRKQKLVKILPSGAKILKFHQSLCPGCVNEKKFGKMLIDCVTYVKDGKVWMIKKCDEHGINKELHWSDYSIYKKAESFQDPGIVLLNPQIEKSEIKCPHDCGLCTEHESHTGLGNIVVTNRCDLSCWYCFFYAKHNDPIYEPTLDQIKFMLKRMRNEKPVGANSIQFTGGEPTLRDDIVEIVKSASELGYKHIQLNTNGINLSKSPDLCMKLREAGVSNLYLSFDGMTPETNPKNYWEAPQAIENCYKAAIGVVLVPTVIGGVNDHELGDIVRFAAGNIHAVRSVNFQPVSLVGRMPHNLRKKQRITIPRVIKNIEEQTGGQIRKEDFFPVPCAKTITDFIEAIKEEPKYRLSVHFTCGMATYVFKNGDKLIALPQFFDVEGFFEYLGNLANEIKNTTGPMKKIKKGIVLAKLMKNIGKYVNEEKKPKDLKFVRMLASTLGSGNYHGLADFHNKSLFIGMMHFQDPNNWDIDRIHKCDIHYATPDGKILPFCTFNVIPELYRDKIQRKFSISAEEWEAKTGKKLENDRHSRSLEKEDMKKIKKIYDRYRKTKAKKIIETDWGKEEINT
jgi:uncharacterized radical SAM superfamily Fe-S cluster-containing enzyme